jgi:hypothetical protein
MKLTERMSPVRSVNLNANNIAEVQTKANTTFALSKVIDRLLGVENQQQKFQENRHYADILQTIEKERSREQIAILNQGRADLVLVAFHRGFVRVCTHVDFENYWNVIGDRERTNTQVLRSYWLGDSFEFDLEDIKNSDNPLADLEKTISERLVNDIVWMVQKYIENPIQIKVFAHARGHEMKVAKGKWRDRYITRWSGVGMRNSTYTYDLIMSLVNNKTIPDNIPFDVLSLTERELILEKLNYKSVKKPKEIAA